MVNVDDSNHQENVKESMAFLCKFSELLLLWSWEGVSGYERQTLKLLKVERIRPLNFRLNSGNRQIGKSDSFRGAFGYV